MRLNRKSALVVFVWLAAFILTACAPAATPVGVVQEYYDAVNSKDVDAAMAFIAPDALFINPTGTYAGADAIRTSLEDLAAADLTFNLSNFRDASGRVVYDYEVLIGGEVVEVGTEGLTIVKNDKIVFDGLVPAEAVYVVAQYYAAVNAKNVDAAMTYIAPDAEFANPTGKYTTTAEIRASLEGLAKDGITFALSNFRGTDGRVVYDYQVLLGSEVLDSGTDGLTIVEDGLIVFDGTERTE